MSEFGLNIKGETGSRRVELECEHQNGLVYVVRAEKNWVCSDDLLHVHSLAGFFRELGELEEPGVKEVMQRWGVYYRSRPLAEQSKDQAQQARVSSDD